MNSKIPRQPASQLRKSRELAPFVENFGPTKSHYDPWTWGLQARVKHNKIRVRLAIKQSHTYQSCTKKSKSPL